MPKKILCFFEGTAGGEVISNPRYRDSNPRHRDGFAYTNIVRLHMLAGGSLDLEKHTGVQNSNQISLYVNGVGGDTHMSEIYNEIEFFVGFLGFQICHMIKKLHNVYEKGDELYVIGFSRGAASARKFVAQLNTEGLKTKTNEHVKCVPVEFLGCFDTVAMQAKDIIGIIIDAEAKKPLITNPAQIGEVHGQLPSNVKKAVHNLSLDDDRFKADIINFLEKQSQPPFPPIFMNSKDSRVHEVYFPGTHMDVGGGFEIHGLSDVSGVYMQDWLKEEGIVFYEPDEIPPENFKIPDDIPGSDKANPVTPDDIRFNPDTAAKDHINRSKRKYPRPCATVSWMKYFTEGVPRIHESVLEHLKLDPDYKIKINHNIKDINFDKGELVVVGSLAKQNTEKTNELKHMLAGLEL